MLPRGPDDSQFGPFRERCIGGFAPKSNVCKLDLELTDHPPSPNGTRRVYNSGEDDKRNDTWHEMAVTERRL